MGVGGQILVLVTTLLWLASLPAIFRNSNVSAAKNEIGQERRRLLATADENPGFISIDCGVDEDYLDEISGIYYKSDKDFVTSGENGDISPEFDFVNANFSRPLRTLRSFPEGRKNCYTLKPEQGKSNNYLIRVFFKYGNYDGNNQVPKFDLYLGVNYWATVELDSSSDWSYYDAIYSSSSDFIFVCLVNTGYGTPFMNALELRTLNNSVYRTDAGFATVLRRYDVGIPIKTFARYKDDPYDRIWSTFSPTNWISVNTTSSIDTQGANDSYKVPSEVLRTAAEPATNLTSMSYRYNYTYASRYFSIYFYFTELQNVAQGQLREFTITINGINYYEPVRPQYLKPLTIRSEKALVQNVIQFSLDQTSQSDLPPILNGFEIVTDSPDVKSGTDLVDVDAIMAIKQIYNISRLDWQGDPCVPRDYSWNGLNCSNYNNTPRITSLNLGSSKLTGEIASAFSQLQAIQSLDLSNNELTGPVPDFLAQLPKLTILNLTGNRLTGPIPQSLLEKSNNGTLLLSFDEKPKCSGDSCEKKKHNFVLPMVLSVMSLLFLLFLILIAFVVRRMRRQRALGSKTTSALISKNRSFTYSEIVSITNNFSEIIGEGGFGKVYLGGLADGTQVAVKLLSQTSKQGLKEFQSEVKLLIMVHHRNLVSLIGYCDDHGNMALVYEYMENGNLQRHLTDRSRIVLSWRERLEIAVDAAHGLEYLHNGCKPPIIHRDLKSANILLNENFLAKISDFGLSRVFATDKDTHVSTNPAGTFGYVDPEFYASGNLNKKSDVYSFGIILFELITGQPVVVRGEEYSTHIVHWVSPMIESGDIQSIVDPKLEGEFNINAAWKYVEIAMSCVPPSAMQRPDMSHVLAELKECLEMEMASAGAERTSQRTTSYAAFEMNSMDVNTIVAPRVR